VSGIGPELKRRTEKEKNANVERPTLNIESRTVASHFQRWTLDVGRWTFASLFVLHSAFCILYSKA
jgi:hypothetical protein